MNQSAPPPVDSRTPGEIAAQVQALLVRYMEAAKQAGIGTGWQGHADIPVADALGRVLYDDVVGKDANGNAVVFARAGTLVDSALLRLLAAGTAITSLSVVALPLASDPGQALTGIFAHLAGLIIARLNQTPDKAFLAFLDLIGVRQLPPQPARVPLTFSLAAGATIDAAVPAGTQVAATAAEAGDPPVFVTEDEIILTSAALVAAFVRDPARDAWSDLSSRAGANGPVPSWPGLPLFRGDQPIERRLWFAHAALNAVAPHAVTVTIAAGPADQTFPSLEWGFFDGAEWQPLTAHAQAKDGGIVLTFAALPPVPITAAVAANAGTAGGINAPWIGGRLARNGVDDTAFVLPPTRIATISLAIAATATDLLPDAAFFGPAAIDITTDFLPFGERPKLGDVFLFSCTQAFAGAGPGTRHEIRLTITPSNLPDGRLPLPDPNAADERPSVTLAWEYWNGGSWLAIGQSSQSTAFVPNSASYPSGFHDDSLAFTAMKAAEAIEVRFLRPPDWAISSVGGQSRYWLRVRIAGGGYGRDAFYTKSGATYQVSPATLRPPSLRMVTVAYRYASPPLAAEHVLVENDFALTDVTATMMPQGTGFVPFPPAGDASPALHLGFVRPGAPTAFANQPVTLYAGLDAISYDEIKDLTLQQGALPPTIAWEYAGSDGWSWLGAQDDTAGFTRSGLVTFIGPPDLVASQAFGRQAFWLRARLESGNYAIAPRLNRVVTNTVWASHATEIADEVIGSGTAEPGQQFQTSHTPVLAGQTMEVGEPEVPNPGELAALIAEEGADCVTIVAGSEPQPEIWVRWHEVVDFYGSTPTSRHYMLDRLSGTITFGGGGRGRRPPRGSGSIRITYRYGGGMIGNCAAGTVTQLKSAVPYVGSVTNLVEAGGGADAEDLASVRRRGPTLLRHRHRAVAIADYEDLAFEASPAVARAKGMPASGAKSAGRVVLVVVPRTSEPRPVPSQELLQVVQDYVSGLAPPTVDLLVRGPDWVAVSVAVELTPKDFDRAMELRSAVIAQLDAFLHPLTGGLDGGGWAFGRSPHRSDLFALIEAVPGVDYIQTLTTTTTPNTMTFNDHALLYSGDHQVTLLAPARKDG